MMKERVDKMEKIKMFVGGKWTEGREFYELHSPYDHALIAQIPLSGSTEAEAALSSADRTREVMRKLTALERSKILEKVSQLFEDNLERCAFTLAAENAKPLKAARMEVRRTIETYKFAAEEAKKIHGEVVPMDAAQGGKGVFGFTKREPVGVIAAITPFNYPFNLVAHKLGPAFAAGNTVVLKPAYQTPLSAILTAEFFERAGLPAGALHVLTGRGSVLGNLLVNDHRVKMVTFTGSVEVGRSIKEKAGLKRVALELGSNSAVIVDSVYDLDPVASRCVEGAFSYAGQICISVQRIYVKEELYEAFLELLVEKTKLLQLGDPRLESTDVSSLITADELVRVENWLQEAVERGATIVCGGKREGSVFQPTIVTGVHPESSISCREVFAPVVAVNAYTSWDEAIALTNDSAYGLQAGVFTTSIAKAFDAVERIEVGGVIINDVPTFRVDNMPYGGIKNSGVGKEGVHYSAEEMTELKFVAFKLDGSWR